MKNRQNMEQKPNGKQASVTQKNKEKQDRRYSDPKARNG